MFLTKVVVLSILIREELVRWLLRVLDRIDPGYRDDTRRIVQNVEDGRVGAIANKRKRLKLSSLIEREKQS